MTPIPPSLPPVVTGNGAPQGVTGQPATSPQSMLGPDTQDNPTVSEAARAQAPAPDDVPVSGQVSEFIGLMNDMIGAPRLGGAAKEWMESTLTGERHSTFHMDEEWRLGLARALGVPEDQVHAKILDQLFGNGDGVLDDDVEISVCISRGKELLPQIQARIQICNEGLINILRADGIRWIDQAAATSDVDVVGLARSGDPDMFRHYLAIAWSIYANQASTPEEAMQRSMVARNIENGGEIPAHIPEEVEDYLRYAYLAGLDDFLTNNYEVIGLEEDLEFSDPTVRQNFMKGLFAIFVKNGDLPMTNDDFIALYADIVGRDKIDADDLALIAEKFGPEVPIETGAPTPQEVAPPAEGSEAPETPPAESPEVPPAEAPATPPTTPQTPAE